MYKAYCIKETDHLLKEVFGKKFIKERTSKEPTKCGDIFIYSTTACKRLVISDGRVIHTIFHASSWKELYGYARGLYDTKFGKIKREIKHVKDMKKIYNEEEGK